MADYAAEIEVLSDGEAEHEEITNYDEVQDYLANGTYPEGHAVSDRMFPSITYTVFIQP